MSAFQTLGALQPVGVLLGGSGRARVPILPSTPVAALLRPVGFVAGVATRDRVAGAAAALA